MDHDGIRITAVVFCVRFTAKPYMVVSRKCTRILIIEWKSEHRKHV